MMLLIQNKKKKASEQIYVISFIFSFSTEKCRNNFSK